MYVYSHQGNYEDAQQLVFEKSANFLELDLVKVSKDVLLKEVLKLKGGKHLVISFEGWDKENSLEDLQFMFGFLSWYSGKNYDSMSQIVLVMESFQQCLSIESYIRSYSEQVALEELLSS